MPMTLAILANPRCISNRNSRRGSVAGPLTDRGFWVENDGARMFALIIDEPREVEIDINPDRNCAFRRMIREGGEVRCRRCSAR